MNENYDKNVVTLVLPKDMTILEDKYAEVLADIVCEMLTKEEIEYLIEELDKNY